LLFRAERLSVISAPIPLIEAVYATSKALARHGSGLMPSPGEACAYLQTAFLNEVRPDRRNVRLGIAKRVRRRVDRVLPQDEIVLVRSGRAENELGIGQRFEFHRFARRLESREIPVPQFIRRRQNACGASHFSLSFRKVPFGSASMLAARSASYSHSYRHGVASPASMKRWPSEATDHRSYRRHYRKCRSSASATPIWRTRRRLAYK
jgi:hypothetical protein